MPRVFEIIETEVRHWRVTLSDEHANDALARGGEHELELCACDQTGGPSPHLGDKVELLSVENGAVAVPSEEREAE